MNEPNLQSWWCHANNCSAPVKRKKAISVNQISVQKAVGEKISFAKQN